MKVLLIEDSQTLQFQLTKLIEGFGHEVIVAESGETAIQILEQISADLIICDVEMPGLSGFETVPIIRDLLGDHWVPIIMMTGRESVEDCVEGLSIGADDYLVKPVHKSLLHAKIKVMERFIDMQERIEELKNQPAKSSQYDELTHVYTEPSFFEHAESYWAISARQKLTVSLLLIDIDYYGAYVDYCGQQAADDCMQQVANAIHSSSQRPGDLVGRYRASEFIVLLTDTSEDGAARVAQRITAAVEELGIQHRRSKVSGAISVSVGGSVTSNVSEFSIEQNIEHASELLNDTKLDLETRYQISRLGAPNSASKFENSLVDLKSVEL
ncbi:diguanylate cyclase domain-containing protein [Aliikangiella sp. G2MR2-5]|uniref:diguanylate cyclase domain-containing protein n=1 Tax=Aliikangiella sp. G2MR2-5 TaxID=2788943 RepID=UPI0018ABB3DD|nr:diguanylate cyclase [Aliikangiella sp. G2MR2-5]